MGDLSNIRITQHAMRRAGGYGLGKHLGPHENLSGLLKDMAFNSATATGRAKDKDYKRRRYGDFVLILKDGYMIDVVRTKRNYCRGCLGAKITSAGYCQTCKPAV